MRSSRLSLPRRAGAQGFALMALLIMLTMGGLYFFISNLTPGAVEARRNEQTDDALSQARDAMLGYVLRYREAVYRTIRELALSFFHEYFTDDGEKTLRAYSGAIDLSRFDRSLWMTTEKQIWDIYAFVDDVRHYPILTRAQIARLRPSDPIERRMGVLTDWPHPRRRKADGNTMH